MAGIRLEWAQFGDFDSFDVIRSNTSIADVSDSDLPSAIATNLKTMYYVDTTVTHGNTYFYRVKAWRDDVSVVSSEIECTADRDEFWANVVALLHFDNNLNDETANDIYTKTSGISFVDAKFGKGISIQNTSDCVICENNASLSLTNENFCIEFYLFLNEYLIGTNSLLTKWSSNNSACEFILYIDNGDLGFDVRSNDSATYVPVISCTAPFLNKFVHIALTRNANDFRIFFDGIEQVKATNTVVINQSTSTQLTIGGYPSLDWKLNGIIDEFRITKGIARYTENFTPPNSPFLNQ